jgi:hypothetical protein
MKAAVARLYMGLERDDGLPEHTVAGIVWTVGAYGFQCFDAEPGQDGAGDFVALEVQYVGPAGYEAQTRGLLAMALGQGDVSRVREAIGAAGLLWDVPQSETRTTM